MIRRTALAVIALVLLAACSGAATVSGGTQASAPPTVVELLDAADATVLDQPVEYPTGGTAEISSAVLTLQPGEKTGWHHHEAPLYAHILEGEITVDYRDHGSRTYAAGESLMEAVDVSHNGHNDGDQPVKILVVNLGAAGVDNTVPDE
jgi:quercetin dioxygenase-like cupin family protein